MNTGYVDFRAAAIYTSLSVRFLRDHLYEIRHLRTPGKILFAKADLDRWLENFIVEPRAAVDVKAITERVLVRRGNLATARSRKK